MLLTPSIVVVLIPVYVSVCKVHLDHRCDTPLDLGFYQGVCLVNKKTLTLVKDP
jgi:hypothetical protein